MQTIGSIVYLKEGGQKMMILNRGPIVDLGEGQVYFDYSACAYPVGFSPEQIFYFNEENIDKVLFEGYRDEEEERFIELYKNWFAQNGKTLKKGAVKDQFRDFKKSRRLSGAFTILCYNFISANLTYVLLQGNAYSGAKHCE
jgi:hypothetical protein